jgi:hypothetical protein
MFFASKIWNRPAPQCAACAQRALLAAYAVSKPERLCLAARLPADIVAKARQSPATSPPALLVIE